MTHKIPTGIPGLDPILGGGFIPHRSYLILGAAGTGKTILSLQWLKDGVKQGEKCLYIALSETQDDIENNVSGFGWDLKGINVIDFVPIINEKQDSTKEYRIFTPEEVEQSEVWDSIYRAIGEFKPARLVIDSISELRFLSVDDYQFRQRVLALAKFVNERHITSLLLFDPMILEKNIVVGLAVDAILKLKMQKSPDGMLGLRYLDVEKYRGSGFLQGYHPFRIADNGLEFFSHINEKLENTDFSDKLIVSGIPRLDKMLGDGLHVGTTTIISGHTGTGKSNLAVQFLINSANQGIPGLILLFEESKELLITRCRQIGMPINHLLETGKIKLLSINPSEMYPDELLGALRRYIDETNCELVILDSVSGYMLAMEEYGVDKVIPHLHNLITLLKSRQITTFLVNEIHALTGPLTVTSGGLSRFGDNIILIRLAERAGKIIKVVSCLKKRLGSFESEAREMKISDQGLSFTKKLKNFHGILGGRRYFTKEFSQAGHEKT